MIQLKPKSLACASDKESRLEKAQITKASLTISLSVTLSHSLSHSLHSHYHSLSPLSLSLSHSFFYPFMARLTKENSIQREMNSTTCATLITFGRAREVTYLIQGNLYTEGREWYHKCSRKQTMGLAVCE